MVQLVTIRANESQVIPRTVFPISIYMMQFQDLWMFLISTGQTFIMKPKSQNFPFNSRLIFCRLNKLRMPEATTRTEYFIFGRRSTKFFATFRTLFFNGAFEMLRLVIAFSRAIFSYVLSVFNYSELRVANSAFSRDPVMFILPIPIALIRTKTKRRPSVARHSNFFAALFAGH